MTEKEAYEKADRYAQAFPEYDAPPNARRAGYYRALKDAGLIAPDDFKATTGHDSPLEYRAYERGYWAYNQTCLQAIRDYSGANSQFQRAITELLIEYADYLNVPRETIKEFIDNKVKTKAE